MAIRIWAQPSMGTALTAPRPLGMLSKGTGPRLPDSCTTPRQQHDGGRQELVSHPGTRHAPGSITITTITTSSSYYSPTVTLGPHDHHLPPCPPPPPPPLSPPSSTAYLDAGAVEEVVQGGKHGNCSTSHAHGKRVGRQSPCPMAMPSNLNPLSTPTTPTPRPSHDDPPPQVDPQPLRCSQAPHTLPPSRSH